MKTLLCVPYAGGTGQGYARLQRWAGPHLRLIGLDLPGRGLQRRLPPPGSLAEAVSALAAQARAAMPEEPGRYEVLGHSFGALLAHRMTAALCADGLRPPGRLIVSCCPPPDRAGDSSLSADELLGTAVTALRETAPAGARTGRWTTAQQAGRRDLLLLQSEPPDAGAPVVPVPLLGLYGIDDPLRPGETMNGWARWTTASFSLRAVPGGHFCFREHPAHYIDALCTRPEPSIRS